MWLTALILGFASSLHCVGMCSPLMMAVTRFSPQSFLNRLVYNGGRIATYGILGMMVASVGLLLAIQQYQNILSIVLGVFMVAIALFQLKIEGLGFISKATAPFATFIKEQFSLFLRKKNLFATGLLGMLNGLLPCGMSFFALTYCLVLKGPIDGLNFMLLFGLGTLPAMLGAASIISSIVKKFQLNFQNVTVALVGISGVLLIVRVVIDAGIQAHAGGKDLVDVVLCR
ncbi:MAG TPA: sulfite exporter TauE/SafE family protein [Chryseosolibacter sp.]